MTTDRARLEIVVIEEQPAPGQATTPGGGTPTPIPSSPGQPDPSNPSAVASFAAGIGVSQGSRLAAGLAGATGSGTAAGLAAAGTGAALGALAIATNPLVIAFGALAVGGFVLKESFQSITRQLDSMRESLAPFSAGVAGGGAAADILRLESRIRQASEIGGALGEFLEERGELDAVMRDIQTNILRPLLPIVTDAVELLTAILRVVEGITDFFPELKSIPEAMKTIEEFLQDFKGKGEIPDRILQALQVILQMSRKFIDGNEEARQNTLREEILKFLDPAGFDPGAEEFDPGAPRQGAPLTPGGRGPLG